MTAISAIPNLGPASDAAFARAGIDSAEALRALGADAARGQIIAAGIAPHFIGYHALVMGLQGRPWHDSKGEEKAELRRRFDVLKAAAVGPSKGDAPGYELSRFPGRIGLRATGAAR